MTMPESNSAAGARPVTHDGAARAYGPGVLAERERYGELTMRCALACAYAKLRAAGTYDPEKHGTGGTELLTAAEHLKLLALGRVPVPLVQAGRRGRSRAAGRRDLGPGR